VSVGTGKKTAVTSMEKTGTAYAGGQKRVYGEPNIREGKDGNRGLMGGKVSPKKPSEGRAYQENGHLSNFEIIVHCQGIPGQRGRPCVERGQRGTKGSTSLTGKCKIATTRGESEPGPAGNQKKTVGEGQNVTKLAIWTKTRGVCRDVQRRG